MRAIAGDAERSLVEWDEWDASGGKDVGGGDARGGVGDARSRGRPGRRDDL